MNNLITINNYIIIIQMNSIIIILFYIFFLLVFFAIYKEVKNNKNYKLGSDMLLIFIIIGSIKIFIWFYAFINNWSTCDVGKKLMC